MVETTVHFVLKKKSSPESRRAFQIPARFLLLLVDADEQQLKTTCRGLCAGQPLAAGDPSYTYSSP
jgi:hypothetical protein